MKFKREVSADSGMLSLNTRDWVQYRWSLSIIRLANYSVITSFIYKSDS